MIEAIIDSNTYNIADVDIRYSMCKHKGTAVFEMDHNQASLISTFDDVEIKADGTTMFKGFVDVIEEGTFPYTLNITAECPIIKAERTWFDTEYVSSGELASTWINTFMNLAQITDKDVDVGDISVYDGHSWTFSTALDALKNLVQLTNARLYSTRNGTTTMKSLNTSGSVDYTITNYVEMERIFSTAITRNRARVFGIDGIVAESSGSNSYLVSGEDRVIAISSGLIRSSVTAQRIANELMTEFNKPLQMYTFTVEGQPQLSINDYVSHSEASGPITSLRHLYNDERFVTEITIGEICPSFFGIDFISLPLLYAGTQGNGVWKMDDNGSWSNISGATLAGATVPAIHWDDTYLWAITSNNIYRGDGAGSWTLCSILSAFHAGPITVSKSDLDLRDIITSSDDSSEVYVVAHDEGNDRIVVLISYNQYLFDRMLYFK